MIKKGSPLCLSLSLTLSLKSIELIRHPALNKLQMQELSSADITFFPECVAYAAVIRFYVTAFPFFSPPSLDNYGFIKSLLE